MKKAVSIIILTVINVITVYGQWCPNEYNLLTDFETNTETVIIDTSIIGNSWQIGTPQKSIFNSAFSGNKAIVTDTIIPYPTNNLSTFIIRLDSTQWQMWQERSFLTFTHKFDTDTLKDGGYIEVSYDSINWVNIVNDTMPANGVCTTNFYAGTISNGEMAFSGKSNGWITSSFHWIWHYGVKTLDNPPSLMYLRFVFNSDSLQTNKEGWMIDDIHLGFISYGGINENNNPTIITKVVPNPVYNLSLIKIENVICRTIHLEIFDVTGKKLQDQSKINDNYFLINRSDFNTGLYFYRITINDRIVKNGRFIIE